MLDLPDPISDLLGVFFKRALDSKIAKRAELLLEMGIASAIAGLGATGAALMANMPTAWSIGAGMTASAVALLATFSASSNSKGLLISLQDQVPEKKLDSNITTIERK
jgi:hypothetical protein